MIQLTQNFERPRRQKGRVNIPFFVDNYDDHSQFEICLTQNNSLTGEALNKKTPLFLNETQIRKRVEQGRVIGTPSKVWFGVPLIRGERVLGIIAVHSYDNPNQFSQADKNILISVSHQIALAIEIKQSLDERNVLENYLSNIINSMPSILVGVDKTGEITQWNHQAELDTGINQNRAIGEKLVDVFPRLSQHMGQIKESIQSQKMKTILKQGAFIGKTIRYEDIIIYPLKTEKIQGVVVRIDDITDQVRMEEMMIQSEKMLSIGGLAAGMAHEINNPLAGMMQNAQVAINRLSGDLPANHAAAREIGISLDDIKAYMEKREVFRRLHMINDTGKRAAKIVENMLFFARKTNAVQKCHDLGKLLKKSVELAQNDCQYKNRYNFKSIQIIEDFDHGVPPVFCDKDKLQQVFLNILKNGAHAMFDSQINTCSPQFVLRLYRKESMVCIEIENNGPIMDDEIKKRLFEPFFTTKPIGDGTGLGLFISYFIVVTDHKGELTVESTPDTNTRFVIKLPQKKLETV
ncbi:MAG: GAF domain-containing protein [Desulfobacter sp.]|nr:GAF domain-containing protein [Desulfobacter sp.]